MAKTYSLVLTFRLEMYLSNHFVHASSTPETENVDKSTSHHFYHMKPHEITDYSSHHYAKYMVGIQIVVELDYISSKKKKVYLP